MKSEIDKRGFVKRRGKKVVGLFVDGVSLDRATRRINRKIDLAGLIRGVTSGTPPTVARYYTIVPHEDDSRQRAFLDAVSRAGFTVIVKRLPPKNITRQVSIDLEMAADIVAFALGRDTFTKENEYLPEDHPVRVAAYLAAAKKAHQAESEARDAAAQDTAAKNEANATPAIEQPATRSIVVVCPSRELTYPISLAKECGADTTSADFSQFMSGDLLKSAQKWLDLSNSEMIWRNDA
jgi:hypothetical protein